MKSDWIGLFSINGNGGLGVELMLMETYIRENKLLDNVTKESSRDM
jgi:hypothetical protein